MPEAAFGPVPPVLLICGSLPDPGHTQQSGAASPLDSAFLLLLPRQAVSPSPDQEQGSAQQDAPGAGWPRVLLAAAPGSVGSTVPAGGHRAELTGQGCLPLLLSSCGTGWPHTQPWCPHCPPPLGLPHHSPSSSLHTTDIQPDPLGTEPPSIEMNPICLLTGATGLPAFTFQLFC